MHGLGNEQVIWSYATLTSLSAGIAPYIKINDIQLAPLRDLGFLGSLSATQIL